MKHTTATRIVFALLMMVGIIGFTAFRGKGDTSSSFRKEYTPGDEDTATRRRGPGAMDKNLDRQLDEAMKKLDVEMKELDQKLKSKDFSKINKDIEEAMKIDFEKMGRQIEAEMKKVNFEKIAADAEHAVSKVDCEKMKAELHASMQKLREVEMPKLKEQMAKMHEHMAKSQAEIARTGRAKIDVEKAMEGARESMAKAKVEMQNLKEFTDELQKDGLIDKSKNYRVEVKNGELYLNGKKQPKEVSDKYRKYFKKENFQIQQGEDDDRI